MGAGGAAAGVAAATGAGAGVTAGGADGVTRAASAPRGGGATTGPGLPVVATVTPGDRESRTKASVTSTAALVPRTPIKAQSHQRRLAARNGGRATVPGATTALALSSSARLRAS
jgi:hypothetical protein